MYVNVDEKLTIMKLLNIAFIVITLLNLLLCQVLTFLLITLSVSYQIFLKTCNVESIITIDKCFLAYTYARILPFTRNSISSIIMCIWQLFCGVSMFHGFELFLSGLPCRITNVIG